MDQLTEQRENSNIQLWQTCVEMANNVSQRRDTMNNLFVTLNLALTAAIPFSRDCKTFFLLATGILISVLWAKSISNYKQLNAEKFYVIFLIEEQLPLHPFREEWDRLKSNKKYSEGTSLEFFLPITFIVLYIVAIFINILK